MNLLVAAALLLQDKGAEEIFTKMEEALKESKSIQVSYSATGVLKTAEGTLRSELQGLLLVKVGNKVRWELKMTHDGQSGSSTTICNGKDIWKSGFGRTQVTPANPELSKILTRSTIRTGIFAGGIMGAREKVLYEKRTGNSANGYHPTFEVLRFGDGGTDELGSKLKYVLRAPEQKRDYEATLWYQPRSFRLKKRTLDIREDGFVESFVETYDEFNLDANIPDEKFIFQEK